MDNNVRKTGIQYGRLISVISNYWIVKKDTLETDQWRNPKVNKHLPSHEL